jgi:hypothetical protein
VVIRRQPFTTRTIASYPFGMGLFFTDLPSGASKQIRAYVEAGQEPG